VSDEAGGWEPLGPSDEAFAPEYRRPHAMTTEDIAATKEAFVVAAQRANDIGVDVLEIHGAHGYLLHQFLSQLSNHRTDAYGGSFENRIRFLLETAAAVRSVWPAAKPLFVRISASEWHPDGWSIEDSIRLAPLLAEAGVDLIDCSSGGNVRAEIPLSPGYQVPFAEAIRRETGIPTGAVGLINDAAQAEAILAEGRADVVLLARQLLRDPYFPIHAAKELGVPDAAAWPIQYVRAR
jgi:2,4-dienoyl-CoA reductase-like NADH-dependent reductase (Old Yellow Enzyme family)